MVVRHVVQHQLQKDIMKHGEHYVNQLNQDTHLQDGKMVQQLLIHHQKQQQTSQ